LFTKFALAETVECQPTRLASTVDAELVACIKKRRVLEVVGEAHEINARFLQAQRVGGYWPETGTAQPMRRSR